MAHIAENLNRALLHDTTPLISGVTALGPTEGSRQRQKVLSAQACPEPEHLEEFKMSGVSDADILLNLKSRDGGQLEQDLFYGEALKRTNTGRVSAIRHCGHLAQGGWAVHSVDPDKNWQKEADYCSVKPNQPRLDTRKLDEYRGFGPKPKPKVIKYEAPPGAKTKVFYLKVSYGSSRKIAERFSCLDSWEARVPTDCDPAAWDMGFWAWVENEPKIGILVCEGVKKALCAISHGYCAIAIPGVTMGVVKEADNRSLRPGLRRLNQYSRNFRVCFDNDSKASTRSNVWKAQKTLCFAIAKDKGQRPKAEPGMDAALMKRGKVSVVHLPSGPNKGLDDLIVAQGPSAFDIAYEIAVPFEAEIVRRQTRLKIAPDFVLNQRYIGDLSAYEDKKWVAIRAPKGTGKSHALIKIISEKLRAGTPVILITHRVQLGEELSERLGVPYISDLGPQGQMLGFGLCIDSLHPGSKARFNGEDWRDAVVILDEAEQLIEHAIFSDTEVKKNRPAVFRELQLLLNGVLDPESDGQLITLDADLNYSLTFIPSLSGRTEAKPFLIVNEYIPQNRQKAVCYDEKSPHHLLERVKALAKEGKRLAIFTTSQSENAAFSTTNIEKHLIEAWPQIRILRIDSQTIANKDHPAFGVIKRINQVKDQYDVILFSPSIGTGVSIDDDGIGFDYKIAFLSGNLPPEACRQGIARVRQQIPVLYWACEKAPKIFRVGSGSTSAADMVRHQFKEAELNSRRAEEWALDGEDNLTVNTAPLSGWAYLGAIKNQSLNAYRDLITAGLRLDEWFQVEEVFYPPDKDLAEIAKTVKAESVQRYCQKVAEAPEITEAEYEASTATEAKVEGQREKERRYEISRRFLVSVTKELVRLDSTHGWTKGVKNHYFAIQNNRILEAQDNANANKLIKNGSAFLPDLNKAQFSNFHQAMRHLGVVDLVREITEDPTKIVCTSDSVVEGIHVKAIEYQADLRTLGINLPTKYPISCVNAALEYFQLRLDKVARGKYQVRQDNGGGSEVKLSLADGRLEIFEEWEKRDLAKLAESDGQIEKKESEVIEEEHPGVSQGLKEAAQIPRIYI